MRGLEVLIPITLFFSIAATVILRGPFGQALADRIAGRKPVDGSNDLAGREQVEHALGELDDMRQRLTDLEERQDFTERLLAQQREHRSVGPGDERVPRERQ